MRALSRCAFCAVSLLAISPVLTMPLHAAKKSERLAEAKELVAEALHGGIYGRQKQRQELLEQAAEQSPDYEPAYWHRGLVKRDNYWTTPEQVKPGKRLQEYQRQRDHASDNATSQFQLASWCLRNNLSDQARAHLTRVVELEPRNVAARQLLGFRRTPSGWVTQEAIETATAARREDAENLKRWNAEITKIANGLRANSLLRRQAAEARLKAIEDPSAAIAIAQLAGQPDATALLAIEKLKHLGTPVAARELSRIAVFAPTERSREEAGKALQAYDIQDYAPALLSAMYTEVTARTLATFNGFQQVFEQEGRDATTQLVMHGDALANSLDVSSGAAEERLSQIDAMNDRTQLLNQRIATALNLATGQELASNPQVWWNWWNEVNELYVEGEKEVKTTHTANPLNQVSAEILRAQNRQRQMEIQLARIERENQIRSMQSPPRGGTRDCLAAGTVVWTLRGPRAVETSRTGDMVLSQDVETGELAYKVVLKRTIRPKSELVRIVADNETLQASGGHPFWITGEGWVKAREIRSGMQMQTSSGVRTISSVSAGENAESYNLIVDGFHTYFAGQNKMLSHDNTSRQPTAKVVPGLPE